MTYNVFSGTLNPTQSVRCAPAVRRSGETRGVDGVREFSGQKIGRWSAVYDYDTHVEVLSLKNAENVKATWMLAVWQCVSGSDEASRHVSGHRFYVSVLAQSRHIMSCFGSLSNFRVSSWLSLMTVTVSTSITSECLFCAF